MCTLLFGKHSFLKVKMSVSKAGVFDFFLSQFITLYDISNNPIIFSSRFN